MKRLLLIAVIGIALAGIAGLTGCCAQHNCTSDGTTGGLLSHCPVCQGGGGGCGCGLCQPQVQPGTAPVTGAVSYPYYTLHGPRDYLSPAPQSIGP